MRHRHLWTQIVGSIGSRLLAVAEPSWHATLYVTARGLTTSPMSSGQARSVQFDLDFVDHKLAGSTSDGAATRPSRWNR